jgi:hypothetical protein
MRRPCRLCDLLTHNAGQVCDVCLAEQAGTFRGLVDAARPGRR